MPKRPPLPAASTWTVQSLPVRLRNGSERLAQAYRHLLRTRVSQHSDRPARLPSTAMTERK